MRVLCRVSARVFNIGGRRIEGFPFDDDDDDDDDDSDDVVGDCVGVYLRPVISLSGPFFGAQILSDDTRGRAPPSLILCPEHGRVSCQARTFDVCMCCPRGFPGFRRGAGRPNSRFVIVCLARFPLAVIPPQLCGNGTCHSTVHTVHTLQPEVARDGHRDSHTVQWSFFHWGIRALTVPTDVFLTRFQEPFCSNDQAGNPKLS
jgi:hypothetical protein